MGFVSKMRRWIKNTYDAEYDPWTKAEAADKAARRSMNSDPELEYLLKSCSHDELAPLVGYLTNRVSSGLESTTNYKKYHPEHGMYIEEIIHALQQYGGNSIANAYRGHGVCYAEILRDVCKKLGIKREESDDTAAIELKLLVKILDDSLAKMTPEERKELEARFRDAGAQNIDWNVAKPITLLLAQGGVMASGFLAYQIAVIVANAVARAVLQQGLSFAANAALTRTIAIVAGPIGWTVAGLWTAYDLAGPAYRVTIPSCCHIAYLRQAKQR
jgi:uncharacterized protein YaaW (UPF0174 family)